MVVSMYRDTVVLMGHGSKGQIADVDHTMRLVDRFADEYDRKYGKENWLVVYGGDPLDLKKPDVAHVAKHLRDRGTSILAFQSDKVIEWGGVPAFIDYVLYVPTTVARRHPRLAPHAGCFAQATSSEGKTKASAWRVGSTPEIPKRFAVRASVNTFRNQ